MNKIKSLLEINLRDASGRDVLSLVTLGYVLTY